MREGESPRQFDLEKIVSVRFGVGERRLCRATGDIGSWSGACQALFCRTGTPWFGGDAAERKPHVLDLALFDPQRGRGRHNGKSI